MSSENTGKTETATKKQRKKKPLSTHLLAGGGAGFMEALVCHPLDTIKVRMQLRTARSVRHPAVMKIVKEYLFELVYAIKSGIYWCCKAYCEERGAISIV
jgi:hypothetical protein